MPVESGGLVCVFCRRQPVHPDWRPFCSERCRVQDLAHWAEGAYRVPGDAVELDDQSPGVSDEDDAER